jgi:acetyl-CoA acyltransferase
MRETYIIDAIRTPIGNFGGALSGIRADDLAAIPIAELIKRNPKLPVNAIDDVILGCHNQAGEDNRNVARMALLLAGLPFTVPGETVNRLCASGMSAVIHANRAIKAGDGEIFIAGGVEHMTRGPLVISKSSKPFGGDNQLFDSSFGWRFVNQKMKDMYGTDAMGVTAENLAELYNISREDQDLFAFNSQRKAFAAQESGILAEEIVPIEIEERKSKITIEKDEFIKGRPVKIKNSF